MAVIRKVQTIPALLARFTSVPIDSLKKSKVAGYARVSTESCFQNNRCRP